jgi:hypothetical protein
MGHEQRYLVRPGPNREVGFMEELGVVLIVSGAWCAVCAIAIAFCAVSSRADERGHGPVFVWVRSTGFQATAEAPRRTGRFRRASRVRARVPAKS